MDNTLTLELNKSEDLNIIEQTKNIFENISTAFSKAVDKGIELLPIAKETQQVIKDKIRSDEVKTLANSATDVALKLGAKSLGISTSTYNDLKDIKDAVLEGNLKKGLSNVLDIGIDSIKILPSSVKSIIKSGKDLILGDTFDNELTKVMTKQKNTISRIDKNCNKFDEAVDKGDISTLDKLSKSIKKDLDKVMPIYSTLNRAQSILNEYELMKNKGTTNLSSEEKELCGKLH